ARHGGKHHSGKMHEPLHAQLAHVAERHRGADRLLGLHRSSTLHHRRPDYGFNGCPPGLTHMPIASYKPTDDSGFDLLAKATPIAPTPSNESSGLARPHGIRRTNNCRFPRYPSFGLITAL